MSLLEAEPSVGCPLLYPFATASRGTGEVTSEALLSPEVLNTHPSGGVGRGAQLPA